MTQQTPDPEEAQAAIEAEIVREANEAIYGGQIDIASQLKKRAAEYSAELQAA